METVGSVGHGVGISLPGQPSRKEWRAVIENSALERLVSDNSSNRDRIGTVSRLRTNSATLRRRSRNGRQFNSGGSGHSSDSDHQRGDAGGAHLMVVAVSPHELIPQSLSQGIEAVLSEELAQPQNDRVPTGLNAMSMDSAVSSLDSQDDALDQHIIEISRQREQLQVAELELRARKIAHSDILRMKSVIDEQTNQHSDLVRDLQEQIQKRDQQIHQLQQQLEERERELHANQVERNEAVSQVWAKDGLLQQQNNELTTIRRERDNAIAEQKANAAQLVERAELMSQLDDVKEQMLQKERHAQEMEDQHRTTQDMLLYKDEQLREAQTWIARAQELDAYHASANNTLHTELRERTDQLNNLWLGYQRQLADVERYHAQIVQRLQMEVNEVREQNRLLNGSIVTDQTVMEDKRLCLEDGEAKPDPEYSDEASGNTSKGFSSNSKASIFQKGSVEEIQLALPEAVPKGDVLALQHLVSAQTPSTASALPLSGPIAINHYGMHHQSISPAVLPLPLQVMGQMQPVVAVLSSQYSTPAHHQQVVQNQHQQVSAPLQSPAFNCHHYICAAQQSSMVQSQNVHPMKLGEQLQHPASQSGQDKKSTHTSDQHFSHHPSEQTLLLQEPQGTHLESPQLGVSHCAQNLAPKEPNTHEQQLIPLILLHNERQPSSEASVQQHREKGGDQERQAQGHPRKIDEEQHLVTYTLEQSKQKALKQRNNNPVESNQPHHQQGFFSSIDQIGVRLSAGSNDLVRQDVSISIPDLTDGNRSLAGALPDSQATSVTTKEQGANGKPAEPVLLDERSLLACLVRAVPAEAVQRIRISSTLPNRLGKMLAPLHWHDYRKRYGRLDEFVASHSELFVLEGDFIHLQDGARASISAKTAVARAAAAVAAAPVGQFQAPVVVTPVAQLCGRTRKGSTPLHKSLNSCPSPQHAQLLPSSGTESALLLSSGNDCPGPAAGLEANGHSSHLYGSSGANLNDANSGHKGKGDGNNRFVGASRGLSGTPSLGTGSDPRLENGGGSPRKIHGKNNGFIIKGQQSR